MEAANLGGVPARRARRRPALRTAGRRAVVPAVGRCVGARGARRSSSGDAGRPESLGIPTWLYGHEPPNVFATAIAKYFRNATREAILLEVCDAGHRLPARAPAGTVQEIFQDACENYYAGRSAVAPMVLRRPALLDRGRCRPGRCCGRWPPGRAMEEHVHLVDTVEEAVQVVRETLSRRGGG